MAVDDVSIGEGKADFNDLYVMPDPRGMTAALGSLEYQIPQQAAPIVKEVLDSAPDLRKRPILDLCSSYGVNAAQLRCGVDMQMLMQRYAEPELRDATPAQAIAADRAYFRKECMDPRLRVYGLDVSGPAIDYAKEARLIERGWAENLEDSEPSESLAEGLRDVGTILCTGGIGYIGHQTFERLLTAIDRPDVCVISFALRAFSYDRIAESLAEFGLETDCPYPWTFPQRRFRNAEEQEAAIRDIELCGLDPTGLEAEGWYHAACFVSRPAGR